MTDDLLAEGASQLEDMLDETMRLADGARSAAELECVAACVLVAFAAAARPRPPGRPTGGRDALA